MRFLDTLGLHTCVSGQTTSQKVMWKSKDGEGSVARQEEGWMAASSPSSLADVHWLYVAGPSGGEKLKKDPRDVFVKGKIQDVRNEFQVSNLTLYHMLEFLYAANKAISLHSG